ncbi:MAG: DUF1987 domain-containing protein [Flavobacteriales bacterium]|nr:DUF1987 domain-containing protein [Flavobacteriales bacterium]
MEKYFEEGEVDVPSFDFNPRLGIFSIKGRSFPEDTVGVYLPVLEWIDSYLSTPVEETILRFELDYFNSSTYKAFLNILLKLEKLLNQNKKIKVEWYYHTRDVDMKEAGEEFAELVDIPFFFISK